VNEGIIKVDAGVETTAPLLRPLAPRSSLVDEVAERIREAVLGGVLPPGMRLSDSGLAREIGVGRGSVREAFSLLLADGLLERTEAGRGFRVASLAVENFDDTYELRLAIECRAVRILAVRHDASDIAVLGGVVKEFLKAAQAGDDATAVTLDLRFHETLCRLSRSARLHDVFTRDVVKMLTLLHCGNDIYKPLADWAEELPAILDAIERGDADSASAAVENHIERSRQLALACVEAQP
jgi:DNA-binding GntR family transcriptional regulator